MILDWNIDGQIVRIDLVDLVPALRYQWHLKEGVIQRKGSVYLHEEIANSMGLDPMGCTVFLDGDTFNLTRGNLKREDSHSRHFSSYRGVTFDSNRQKWVCQINRAELKHYSRHTTEYHAASVCKNLLDGLTST